MVPNTIIKFRINYSKTILKGLADIYYEGKSKLGNLLQPGSGCVMPVNKGTKGLILRIP